MKKEEMKELVKEAVLEALQEFTTGGVATASEPIVQPGDEEPPKVEDGEDGEDDKKKKPLDPIPNVGVGGL